MWDMQDKVAVVTGGASGIGLAIAERLAREGVSIVLADIEPQPLELAVTRLRRGGADVLGVQTDVSQLESVQQLLARSVERFGSVHLLCNNAGVQLAAPSWEMSMTEWQWIFGVNLWGVIHGIHTFIPHMLAHGQSAHIVNTSSVAGLVSVPMLSAYQVTKHGVITLSESLRQELAQKQARIGVSVLCPGYVPTRLHEAERNRPDAMPSDLSATPSQAQEVSKTVNLVMSGGRSAHQVADRVIDAIQNNRLYVLTHPEMIGAFAKRADEIVAAARGARAQISSHENKPQEMI